MREALTITGCLLIAVFAILFAAPLYIDWNSWRSSIAARLSRDLGTSVRIDGLVQVRFLPQPWVSITRVRIAEPESGTGVTVPAIEGDISLGGLMRGEITLSNVQIRRPELILDSNEAGRFSSFNFKSVAAHASITDFEIVDAVVRYRRSGGSADPVASKIRLQGTARSLAGPYKLEGGFSYYGEAYKLNLLTGEGRQDGVNIRLAFGPAHGAFAIDMDGALSSSDDGPGFTGQVALSASMPTRHEEGTGETGCQVQMSWRLSGPASINASGISSGKALLQLGGDERALTFSGPLRLLFGASSTLEADLSANQLELDRFACVPSGSKVPPVQVLAALAGSLPAALTPTMPVPDKAAIRIGARGAVLGSGLLQNIQMNLKLAGNQWLLDHFDADLPGHSHLSLMSASGAFAAGSGGKVSLRSDNSTGLTGWLRGVAVSGASSAVQKVDLETVLSIRGQEIALSDLSFALGDARATGSLTWRRLEQAGTAGRLEADLVLHRIDLDQLPSMFELLPGGVDVVREADIKLSALSLSLAGVEARSVSGRVKAGGGLVALEDVTVDDLAGASLSANGRIDRIGEKPQGEIRATLNGRDLKGLAAALRQSPVPRFVVDAFIARAEALSPANASFTVAFGDTHRYWLDGKFGGNVVQMDTELGMDGKNATINSSLKIDTFDTGVLLRQIGFSTAAARVPGRASMRVDVSGPLYGARRWNINFDGASVRLAGSGKMTGWLDDMSLDGRVGASTDDVLVPALAFGVALPGVTPGQRVSIDSGFHGKGGRFVFDDVSGTMLDMPVNGALAVTGSSPVRIDGRLNFLRADARIFAALLSGVDPGAGKDEGGLVSDKEFGPALLDNLTGKISVSAGTLRVAQLFPQLVNARAAISFGGGRLSVDGFTSRVAEGSLTGAWEMNRAVAGKSLTGHLVLSGVDVDSRYLAGQLNSGLSFQGAGASPRALTEALTGSGSFQIRKLILKKFSTAAFDTTVAAADAGLAPDLKQIRPVFEQALEAASPEIEAASGSMSLSESVIRISPVLSRLNDAGIAMSGAVELAKMKGKALVSISPPAPPDGLGGPVPLIHLTISGEPGSLHREVDLAGLVAWLAIRSAERQARALERLQVRGETNNTRSDASATGQSKQRQETAPAYP